LRHAARDQACADESRNENSWSSHEEIMRKSTGFVHVKRPVQGKMN